jgi:large repetitive protein
LFRDIQPDQYYPVYGDSSVRGYDAQSTGKLYVRVDRNKSWFVGGDITTGTPDQARSLGAYSRSLTGIREHFEHGAVTLDAFASHDDLRLVVDEIPANGTSGPFFLTRGSAIRNSEKIEILTRDRDQLALVLLAEPRQRFTDYEIEPFTGRLLFRAPIPSADADLNPISIRITYEVEQGVESFLTAGLESRIKLTPSWEVGAAIVDNRDPTDPLRLASTNTTISLGRKTKVVAELAHSDRDGSDKGYGRRIELLHDASRLQLRAYGGRTDEEFDNPAAILTSARSEAGAKAGFSISERTRLVGEAIHTASVTSEEARDGVLLGVERSFANNLKAELGMRRVRDTSDAGPTVTTTTARTRISAPVPRFSAATLFGEYEQDVSESDRRIAAVGGDYRLANRSKIYLRHELISSLSGPYELNSALSHNTTVFGVDASYLTDTHLFSEYRVADAINGREAQAAIGLRNGWTIARGVRVNTSFERLEALRGIQEDTAALTGAVELTRSKRWKGTGRLELRDSDSSQGMLSTLGLAYKLTPDWTFLGKNILAITDNEGTQPDRRQDRAQIGFAFRDSERNRVNSIARYEFKQENGLESALERKAHILSVHADYQRTPAVVWRAQYAAKVVDEDTATVDVSSSAHLIAARVTRDFGKRWDAGLAARALFDGDFDGYEGGVGAEGGYLIGNNLWISAGYNFLGFRDDDLAGSDYTSRGPYLRVRFKFDESLLEGL